MRDAAVLAALVATVLPASDPALTAIVRGWLHGDDREARRIRGLLGQIDQIAKQRCGRSFVACELAERRRVLAKAGDDGLRELVHALEVLFVSPPAVGANRAYRNWRPVLRMTRTPKLPRLALASPPAPSSELAGCTVLLVSLGSAAQRTDLTRRCRRDGARVAAAVRGTIDAVLVQATPVTEPPRIAAAIEGGADVLPNGGRIVIVLRGAPRAADVRTMQRSARALAGRNIAVNAVCAPSLDDVRWILVGLLRAWQPAPSGRLFDASGEITVRGSRSSSDPDRGSKAS